MNEWVKPVDLVTADVLDIAIAGLVTTPPALTRLEPLSVSGDPAPGATARVADPLWFIGRQWQLGELLGEDVGTPVSLRVTSRNLPLTAWLPEGDAADGTWQPWPAGANLDELVQDVPEAVVGQGLRWRAETGAQLQQSLREAGHGDAAKLLLSAHPLAPGDGYPDPAADRLLAVLGGAVPDGAASLASLSGGLPPWVSGADDPDEVRGIADEWSSWVTGTPGGRGAWTTERLEHRFSLRFGHDDDAAVVRARAFGDGSVRWHDLEWDPDAIVELDGDDELPDPGPVTAIMLATPLRYPGMPADRYWQLEDGSVDISAIEAQPHDLARLCLAEFALVSGDDWLVAPVDGQAGSLVQVQEVTLTNTFGETITVAEDADRSFRMFEVTSRSPSGVEGPSDGASLPGVLLPPVATDAVAGEPTEEILFLRDETANMAWAVERVVPGRSGDPRHRSGEPLPTRPAPPDDLEPGDLLYELATPVPAHWIPLVPVSTGLAQVGLRKGAMLRTDPDTGEEEPILPLGALLQPRPLTFPAEEIPREGVQVRTVPVLARRRDGTYARWTARRVHVGRGEGHSGLAYDAAR